MNYEWMPFAAGVILVAAQPAMDFLWKTPARRYFTQQGEYPNVGEEGFENVLAWITDLAQALPVAFLLIVGIILLPARVPAPILATSSAVALLVVLLIVFKIQDNREPHVYRSTFWPKVKHRHLQRSPLQLLLLGMNGIGILVSLLSTHLATGHVLPAVSPAGHC